MLWDAGGTLLHCVRAHHGDGFSLDATPDGQRLVTYGIDRTIRVWDGGTLTLLQEFGTDWGARGIRLSADGRTVLAPPPRADDRGESRLCLWDVSNGKPGIRFDGINNWAIVSEISANGRWLAAAAQERLCVWNAQSGELIHTVPADRATPCRCVTFTPDGRTFVAGYDDGRVCIRSLETGTLLQTIFAHGDSITAVRVTIDGSRLLTGSRSDGRVRVWDLNTGDRVWEIPSGLASITDVRFDAEETRLIMAGPGGIRVWPLVTRKP